MIKNLNVCIHNVNCSHGDETNGSLRRIGVTVVEGIVDADGVVG